MAFVVEDGTRITLANAYMTVAQWKTHHGDRGQTSATDGTYSDTEIQGGIVNSTDYIDKRFGRRFRGWRSTKSQGLEWPRTDAYDDDEHLLDDMPTQLLKGTAEYGLLVLQLKRNLAPPPTNEFGIIDPVTGEATSQGAGTLTKSTDVIGPIEETREFKSTSGSKPMTSTGNLIQRIPEYPQADLWLEELTVSSITRTLLRG